MAEIPNPFRPPQYLDIVNPRHSVDPVTYDLVIDNVTLLDSAASYRCVLSVMDAQRGNIYTYEASEDLELLVYGERVERERERERGRGRERERGREGGEESM